MDINVQLASDGTIVLPAEVRAKYRLEANDPLRLVELEGALMLVPVTPSVFALAQSIEQARIEAGLELDDLLLGLRQERDRVE